MSHPHKSTNQSVASHGTSDTMGTLSKAAMNESRGNTLIQQAHGLYSAGRYKEALEMCESELFYCISYLTF